MTSFPCPACGGDAVRCPCAPDALPEEDQRRLVDALQFEFKSVDHAVGVRRARKIANMTPEAHEAAKRLGLDCNRSALLAAAAYASAVDQVAVLEGWGKPLSPEEIDLKNWNRLVDAWNRAGWQNQVKFLREIKAMAGAS